MKIYSDRPVVSIIVPVYNKRIEHLEICFDSLLNQSYRNLEVIVVNDGSDSNVSSFCDSYSNDKRYQCFTKPHGGVSSARNYGISHASGEYVMFVDSDDWLDKDCCERIFENMTDENDLIFFSYIKEYPSRKEEVRLNGNLYEMSTIGSSCMKLYRRNIIEGTLFDEDLENAEDVEFNFRVFQKVGSPKCVNEGFYHYRIIEDSAVRKFDPDIVNKYEKTIAAIKNDLIRNNQEQFRAYIDFLGIVYLMVLLNYICNKRNSKNKYKMAAELKSHVFVKELFDNSSKLSLPLSRKILIIFGKYNMYFLLFLAVYLKQRMDER
ncbi:glycosyltransferase family 2 protein [Candidatus Saccharibacteria bacterium]|nr:glycosyltransferase family 2 protein [Candidatus Saccharibacteria bacterium]